MEKLRLSVLIITKKYREEGMASLKIKEHNCSDCEFEILIGEGDNPSLQRNYLAEKARGDYLLFLDDDSGPDEKLLSIYCKLIRKHSDGLIFGGPSILKADNSIFQEAQKFFFSSVFGIGPFKGRYNPLGYTRLTDEKELILSNILIEKKYFIKMGGFNKELYPGEENEFLNRNKQLRAFYCPDVRTYRSPRENFAKFLYQIFSYGKGRAKHLNCTLSELVFLIPGFFSLYFISLPFFHRALYLIPGVIYLFLIVTIIISQAKSKIYAQAFFTFLLGHFFYGLGLVIGLCRRLFFRRYRKLTYFTIIRIKDF